MPSGWAARGRPAVGRWVGRLGQASCRQGRPSMGRLPWCRPSSSCFSPSLTTCVHILGWLALLSGMTGPMCTERGCVPRTMAMLLPAQTCSGCCAPSGRLGTFDPEGKACGAAEAPSQLSALNQLPVLSQLPAPIQLAPSTHAQGVYFCFFIPSCPSCVRADCSNVELEERSAVLGCVVIQIVPEHSLPFKTRGSCRQLPQYGPVVSTTSVSYH